ncbi:MAG: hypothetical protein KKG75_01155 [Nanoarchaeota archaeon]|nr:hypothetical protein [Nanoarchaeota archaeon]
MEETPGCIQEEKRSKKETERIVKQKEVEKERLKTAEERAHAEKDTSTKWGRRRAKWDHRAQKYWDKK